MNDLDTLLRDALITDAARAPHLPAEWVGPTTARIVPTEPRRRSRQVWVGIGAAAAAAAAIGGLALVDRPDSAPAPAASTAPTASPAPTAPAWLPPGEEFALTDLGPALILDDVAVAAATRRIGIVGHPDLVVFPSLVYQGESAPTLSRCVGTPGGGSGCTPEWNTVSWTVMITSSVDNHQADFDLWVLDGVGDDVAYVSYVDGSRALWARPVAGIVAFPDVDGVDEVVTGYDEAGVEVASYGSDAQEAQRATAGAVVPPAIADLSTEQFRQLGDLTRDGMRSCLVDRGGFESDGVVMFAEGIDQLAVWDECVAEVKATVADAVAEIGPRFFDPAAGERPEQPDSPFSYGD